MGQTPSHHDLAPLRVERPQPSELGLDAPALAAWVSSLGPLAVVDLETTGFAEDPDTEIIEFGAVVLDPGLDRVGTVQSPVRPRGPVPRVVERLTGLVGAELGSAPTIAELAPAIRTLLEGRVLVAHNAAFERHFLGRDVAPGLAGATFLDTLDLLALTHPDALDLRLESFTRLLLGEEERHRALSDALDTLRVLSRVAVGARAGELRYRMARRALEGFAPDSPWLPLLGKEELAPPAPHPSHYVAVHTSDEVPVPFDPDAIAAVLADEARGRRHLPGYRVRPEQIRLARRFARNLAEGGAALLEGGTGVGKSLAYLAAAIPFAMTREAAGEPGPVVVSTRTKLLQDQLLTKDIPAAARLLGYPELRALSIKGRANYVCARRLESTLAEGREPRLFREDRHAYAALFACARTRPHGEVGALPAALLRRWPQLRELLVRSVASRPEQCSREQCATQPACPFGRRRAALAGAHLVVANHDLLLRWPPDYPRFSHAIVDEVHELADIADEVYALEVRPQELLERLDDLFGRHPEASGGALLPAALRRSLAVEAAGWRRILHQDLTALGRGLGEAAEFGEVELPPILGPRLRAAGRLACSAADRIDLVCDHLERHANPGGGDAVGGPERALADLRASASVLRLPFEEAGADQVVAFEGLEPPFDRWRLAVRRVDPSPAFHAGFLDRLESFAGVSASLFVAGDAFAALGELDFENRLGAALSRVSVPSPFPYARHMRVVVLEASGDLVEETTAALADLARLLGGRTLGLFTSLRRMRQVADLLAPRLRDGGLEVLVPRRASDDPGALVGRFMRSPAVLLGARKFWQGLDIPGSSLQAVVIEKLPFEVPTELRRRREQRLRERGEDAFARYSVGKMLLNLKQMSGRLIRSEEDRGVVVIVEGRTRMGYFHRLEESLPPGVEIRVTGREELPEVVAELGIGGGRHD